jgi:hypothetical protein
MPDGPRLSEHRVAAGAGVRPDGMLVRTVVDACCSDASAVRHERRSQCGTARTELGDAFGQRLVTGRELRKDHPGQAASGWE